MEAGVDDLRICPSAAQVPALPPLGWAALCSALALLCAAACLAAGPACARAEDPADAAPPGEVPDFAMLRIGALRQILDDRGAQPSESARVRRAQSENAREALEAEERRESI